MQRIEESYSLNDYLAAIKRRGHLFFKVAIPVVLLAGALASILPNEYRSFARIDINLEGTNVRTLEPIQVAAYADQYIAELRDRVLSDENLSIFTQNSTDLPGSERGLSASDRMRALREGFYFRLDLQPVTTDYGREVDVISGFRTGFTGSDPRFAERAASFFADSFLREDRESRTEKARSTASFLKKQIADTEAKIKVHEQSIAEFKVKNACCLPELKALNMSVIERAERDIENLQPRIRTLEQDKIFLQAQLEEIRKQSVSTNRLAMLEQEHLRLVANYGPDHPDVARLRREIQAISALGTSANNDDELTMLRIELAEAERKYSEIHPDVIRLRSRIAALEADNSRDQRTDESRLIENPRYLQLRSEINAINTELSELRRRSPALREKIQEYEQYLTRTPQIESEYQALNRSLNTERESFDNLQRRLVIAQQTEALESTEIGARLSLVRPAYLPDSPSAPPRLGILIVGVFLACSLGMGSIILAEVLDSTVRGGKDVTRVMDIMPLATIPVIENPSSRRPVRHRRVIMTSLSLAAVIGITIIILKTLT